MKNKKRSFLVILVALAVVGVLATTVLHRPEPVYQGKPLTFWLNGSELDDNEPGKPKFDDAVEAVRQAGTNAFPTLLRLLRVRDSDLEQRLALFAQKQHFIKVHYRTSDSHRWTARQGFVALGRIARAAIPQLAEINQAEISGALHNNYAGEILDMLKAQDNAAPAEVAKAVKNAAQDAGK